MFNLSITAGLKKVSDVTMMVEKSFCSHPLLDKGIHSPVLSLDKGKKHTKKPNLKKSNMLYFLLLGKVILQS